MSVICAEASAPPENLTSTHEVMDGLLAASRTVASIRGATGKACRMTFAARGGTSSGFLSKAISSALAGSCKTRWGPLRSLGPSDLFQGGHRELSAGHVQQVLCTVPECESYRGR